MESLIQKLLKIFLEKMEIDYNLLTVEEESTGYRANIQVDIPGILIGKDGKIINAIEVLIRQFLWKQNGSPVNIIVDVDDYKKKKEEKLFSFVKSRIEKAESDNLSEFQLRPMPANERRLIHLWIATHYPHLHTESIGENSYVKPLKVTHKDLV